MVRVLFGVVDGSPTSAISPSIKMEASLPSVRKVTSELVALLVARRSPSRRMSARESVVVILNVSVKLNGPPSVICTIPELISVNDDEEENPWMMISWAFTLTSVERRS